MRGAALEPDELRVNYAEGPDDGPVLFLIHGQTGDWQNYARVLPRLVKDFHVFAVACFGHGDSARAPHTYSVEAG